MAIIDSTGYDNPEIEIYGDGQFLLTQYEKGKNKYTYRVYDEDDRLIGKWDGNIDLSSLSITDLLKTKAYNTFVNLTDTYKPHSYPKTKTIPEPSYSKPKSYDRDSYYSSYKYEAKDYVGELNKSDTLVIHKNDPSTVMLKQVYEGKGWDVLNDTFIDKNQMRQLLENHSRIVMLGHGSPYGLIGGNIGDKEAPYLKDKKVFAIWCNANAFFQHHGIGQGQFITKNAPSEKWECENAGCGNISDELMLENITYWCKLCADVVEDCLEGDKEAAVDYIRKNYLEQYGNHPVTIFNADSASLLGIDKPLPTYEFKGKPLASKDYPCQNFDEEEFLKNPTAKVSEIIKRRA